MCGGEVISPLVLSLLEETRAAFSALKASLRHTCGLREGLACAPRRPSPYTPCGVKPSDAPLLLLHR